MILRPTSILRPSLILRPSGPSTRARRALCRARAALVGRALGTARATGTARAAFTTTLAACLVLLALSAGLARTGRAQSGAIQDLTTFPRTALEIQSHSGTHRLDVWVADTQERQTQGLMFVRDLPANEGMLFTNCCSGIWMKNTYIELDILFIGADHRIAKIAPRARPFDLTTISAGRPVKAVVELKGGEAAVLGLKVGDRVEWQTAAGSTAQSKSFRNR